ncbi:MAG: pitrilysin family protein [bacterium]
MSFRRTRLKNGIRVILVPQADTAAVTFLALYEVGSRYETAELSGTSHFIEHLMFKGTRRRPTTLDISRDLDSVGADYNAFTSKDYTGYYVKLPSGRAELAADMLEDMIYHSTYRAGNVSSERQVILEELRMYEDNPLMLVEELVEEELYRGSPLGRRIGGTVETVGGLSRDDLVAYRDRYYVPSRTVLAVAGRFEEAATVELLERTFGQVGKGTGRGGRNFEKFDLARAGYRKPRLKVVHRDTEQVQAAISFPALSYDDPDLPAAKVMSTILGGTMSSRLFTTVREKEGLCYFIRSQINPYQDVGDLTIQSGLAKDRVDLALRLTFREIAGLVRRGATAAELKLAQEYIRGKTLLALEDSSHKADWYAKQELLTRRIDTPEERLAKIAAVRRDDVQRMAKRIFRRNRLSMAIIGPFDGNGQFASVADELSS